MKCKFIFLVSGISGTLGHVKSGQVEKGQVKLGHVKSGPDMGVCAGGCPIPTFTNFNLRDFFFANSGFNITFGSETFRSFNSSEDDLNIV